MTSLPLRAFGMTTVVLILVASTAGCPDTTDPRIEFLGRWLDERAPLLSSAARGGVVDALLESETATGIDAFLLLAVIEEESRYDPEARSRKGARGLMQVRPETARGAAARAGIAWEGPEILYDPAKNVRIGATYLARMKERFGHWNKALAAYHSGPTRIRKIESRGGRIPKGYASSVLRRHRQIHDAYNNSGS